MTRTLGRAAATALLGLIPLSSAKPIASLFAAVSEVSSGWLVGGAVCAMLLGHWQLRGDGMWAVEEQQTRRRAAQANKERSKSGFPTARGTFYEKPVARMDL